MNSPWMPRVEALYQAYIRTAEELEKNRPVGAGLFGLTPGPEDDPCHDRFAAELDALLREVCAASPSSAEAAGILRFLFRAPDARRQPKSLYWMLVAVQGLGGGLVDHLEPEDASALAKEYADLVPRRERLPVQKQLLKKLERAAR